MPVERIAIASDKKKKPPNKGGDGGTGDRLDRQSDTMVKERTKRPRRYQVLLHNDDFTPMEFVTQILETIFRKSGAEATRIMLTVHNSGLGVAGVYSREIAETKAMRTIQLAREAGYPLMVSTEPE